MTPSAPTMRIGEVHAVLRQDFPDVELSKIRYYEDKGLVRPARSRKGYRLYGDRDVACLREAIRLAQEEFVPLRVVRLRLIEQGLLDDDPPTRANRHAAREAAVSSVRAVVRSEPAATVRPIRELSEQDADEPSATLTTAEFLLAVNLSPVHVNELVAVGLLNPRSDSGETVFTAGDVQIARAAAALLARGVDPRRLAALRRVVEREIGILDEWTAPLRQPGSDLDAQRALELTRSVASDAATLRASLYERFVNDYLDQ